MFINHYTRSVWYRSLAKDGIFLLRFVYLFLRNGLRTRMVLFYPDFPLYRTEINKILRRTNYNFTNNPRLGFQIAIAWEDTTFRPRYPLLEQLQRDYPVLNLRCDDISKRRVEQAFMQVFGYGLAVDPTSYKGSCVRKSDLNGRHNETVIVQCPVASPETDAVYQRLLDNGHDAQTVLDIRVQIYGQDIPFVNARYKPRSQRFYGEVLEQMRETGELLSSDEVARLLQLADIMGLDYGEIDCVRDNRDGRLYVVDVNNTPYSPPAHIFGSRARRRRFLQRGARAFCRQFLSQASVRGKLSGKRIDRGPA